MPSPMMRVVSLSVRLVVKRKTATTEGIQRWLAAPKNDSSPPASLLRRHRIDRARHGSFTSFRLSPDGVESPTGAFIYLHGGSFVNEIARGHWGLVDKVASGTRGLAYIPINGLAPQHSHSEAIQLVRSVWDQALNDFAPEDIALVGDSAGGGLALSFSQLLLQERSPTAGQLVLIAPWLDLTLNNPRMPLYEKTEPCLNAPALRAAGKAWAAGEDPRSPILSPMFARVEGLPPTHIYVGTRDIFFPDVHDFTERARAAGSDVRLHTTEGAIHVFPLTPTSEGRRARSDIVEKLSRYM